MLSVVPGLMIVHIRTKGVRMRTVYHKHLYLLPRSSVYISTLILTHKSFAWRRTGCPACKRTIVRRQAGQLISRRKRAK